MRDEPNTAPLRDDGPVGDADTDAHDALADGPTPGHGACGAPGAQDAAARPGLAGWRQAAEAALYGPGGFYLRPEGPAGHFRTSVHASPLFAAAVARLLCRVDEALGRPAELAFVDMGAGRGELVTAVLRALPADVAPRARGYAVERAAPPAPGAQPDGRGGAQPDGRGAGSAAPAPTWCREPPRGVTGLLFANEWLDNVPVDVVETDADGVPRRVLVGRDGAEMLGDPVGAGPDARWLERWWPLGSRPGLRAEVGRPRDAAWAAAVGSLGAGLAVAVDYLHLRAARPPYGTLTGFRAGREVPPVPDGSCDITAHVALDACAEAGRTALQGRAGSATRAPRLLTQREALHALGVDGARPPLSLAASDPAGYVRALAAAGEAAELTARDGLGAFGWLVQPVAMSYPAGFGPLPPERPPAPPGEQTS